MSQPILTSTIANTLKDTLDTIVDDNTDGIEENLMYPDVFEVSDMDDAFEDDLTSAGPGTADYIEEGGEYPTKSITEGYITRYWSRKHGLQMIASDEAVADGKYNKKILNFSRRMKRALYKTFEIMAANIFNRAFNSAYVGGDDVSLVSASHTLATGGTWSNTMATVFSPGRASYIVARAQVAKFPGFDGTKGDKPVITDVICPVDQESAWEGLFDSEKAPEGNTNEINVAYKGRSKVKIHANIYYDATTTSYLYGTDADDGLKFKWKLRPTTKTWADEPTDSMRHKISGRVALGWTNPRRVLGVAA